MAGKTKVAMYGMGNIRDERLHRTFKANKVKWSACCACFFAFAVTRLLCARIRPAKDKEDWFNLCVIHQNRCVLHHSASSIRCDMLRSTRHTQEQKNYISESMLPDFLDFVVWVRTLASRCDCSSRLRAHAGPRARVLDRAGSERRQQVLRVAAGLFCRDIALPGRIRRKVRACLESDSLA